MSKGYLLSATPKLLEIFKENGIDNEDIKTIGNSIQSMPIKFDVETGDMQVGSRTQEGKMIPIAFIRNHEEKEILLETGIEAAMQDIFTGHGHFITDGSGNVDAVDQLGQHFPIR